MKQRGQTAIEYLLIMVVAVGLGITFFNKMKEYFQSNPNSFISRSLNNYRRVLGDPQGRYKRFQIPK